MIRFCSRSSRGARAVVVSQVGVLSHMFLHDALANLGLVGLEFGGRRRRAHAEWTGRSLRGQKGRGGFDFRLRQQASEEALHPRKALKGTFFEPYPDPFLGFFEELEPDLGAVPAKLGFVVPDPHADFHPAGRRSDAAHNRLSCALGHPDPVSKSHSHATFTFGNACKRLSFFGGYRTMGQSMPDTLTAQVIPEKGAEFEATVSNLATSSLFVISREKLSFREAVTVKFERVAVHGEVAFLCREPPGAVIVFRPSPEAIDFIENEMDEILIVEGGGPLSLEALGQISDAELDALPDSDDPEGPTNTEGEPIDVDDEESEDVSHSVANEVREAFVRTKYPANVKTERVEQEDIMAVSREVMARRSADRDPTLIPERQVLLRSQTVLAEVEDETMRPTVAGEKTPFEEQTEPPTESSDESDSLEETSDG